MYLAYSYFIRNKITGQFYYGSRHHNVKLKRAPEKDFWIHYFTSSKSVKNLIEQYGIDSFEYKIILMDKNFDKCYWHEQTLIKEHIKSPLCLNRHFIDPVIGHKFSTAGYVVSPETGKKISIANTGRKHSAESSIKKSKSTKGRSLKIPRTKEHQDKLNAARAGRISPNKGKSTILKGKTYDDIHGIEKSAELKLIRSIGRKGKQGRQNVGGKNHNAKSVCIDNVTYSSMKEACCQLNLTYYELSKLM